MQRAAAFAVLLTLAGTADLRSAQEAAPQRPSVFDLPRIQAVYDGLQAKVLQLFQSGDYGAAEKACAQSIQLVPHAMPGYYNLACAQARQGKVKEALDHLEKAVQFGLRDAKKIQEDEDLRRLRGEPRFAEIVEQASREGSPPPQPWRYTVKAAPIEGGVASVTEQNTAWDGRLGVFRAFFQFDKPPQKEQEAILDQGEAGELVRRWRQDGSAAGNRGDLYDNHDNDHSNMRYQQFPELTRVEFSPEAKKRGLHNGLQLQLLYNGVTLGNSSTAITGGPFWRSQPRLAYTNPRLAGLLYVQYVSSHLYVYPEHRDYDPGHNGDGGYGDVYPANTPYLIISQGSSGSDRPFLEAVACTLAAFQPEVKRRLAAGGTLMPTVQMIFRSCNRNLESPEDYLTGKAHPTVFQGKNIDAAAMVKMAHEMTLDYTPPMIQLKVLEEDHVVVGRDCFDVADRARLFDTPAAIARVFRTTKYARRMVVSAEASRDLQQHPLTWRWSVLRGDAETIQIKPLNEESSVVELLAPYQPRRPIAPGADMWSNRIDIGAFVHNGRYYSAPGFVTFFTLDSETRVYNDKKQIQDVWYGLEDNYVDPQIGLRKKWWDHYHYDDQHRLIGWTRYRAGRKKEFTADGAAIVQRDGRSRALTARTVKYVAKSDGKSPAVLEQQPGGELLHYQYASDEDRVGTVASRTPAP